jgi:hypothetical protein
MTQAVRPISLGVVTKASFGGISAQPHNSIGTSPNAIARFMHRFLGG